MQGYALFDKNNILDNTRELAFNSGERRNVHASESMLEHLLEIRNDQSILIFDALQDEKHCCKIYGA